MKKALFSLAVLAFLSTQLCAQDKQAKKDRSSYIDAGFGFSMANFRDFGTSPLVYSGLPKRVSLSMLSFNELKEVSYGIDFDFGNYSSVVGDEIAVSQVKVLTLRYQELHRLDVFNSDKWNLKVGGTAMVSGDFRLNPSLQNAAVGYEVFMNIMASGKITMNMDREEDKQRKIWFVKYTSKARKRNLSYNLNLGLINHNYRNGYTYVNQEGVLNKFPLFGEYGVNSFNGFRMGSELAYTRYMASNNNALRFSYVWDAFKSSDEYDAFEMAFHTIKISLMFQVK